VHSPTCLTCTEQADPKFEGCHGLSSIVEFLPYVDYNNVWIVPVGHCLLFGVTSNFIAHAFRQGKRRKNPGDYDRDMVPHATRDLIEKRGKHLTVPSDFGRKYKSILRYQGSYTMEDWLHFVEAFSPYLFSPGTLPPVLQDMWDHLVTAILHYFHAGDSYTDAASRKAASSLLAFAKLVEQHFPKKYCTFNLHMAVCR
jgi:hypothetical protein